MDKTRSSKLYFSTKFDGKDKDGNDINAYVKAINSIYGKNYITKNKIRSYAYLDLFDPFLVYSGYSFVMNTNLNDIPMIELGPVKYYLRLEQYLLHMV